MFGQWGMFYDTDEEHLQHMVETVPHLQQFKGMCLYVDCDKSVRWPTATKEVAVLFIEFVERYACNYRQDTPHIDIGRD